MTAKPKTAHRIDRMFRAFSDRTRLRILLLLQEGESCVGDLVHILGVEQPQVSRHLAYLKRAGLVSVRRMGTWCFYSLAAAQGGFHAKLLECLSCCFQEVPQMQADAKRAARVRASGGCCPEIEKGAAKKLGKQKPCC